MTALAQQSSTALLATLAQGSLDGAWTLDPSKSSVSLKTKSMWGLIKINAVFTDVQGEIAVVDGAVTARIAVERVDRYEECQAGQAPEVRPASRGREVPAPHLHPELRCRIPDSDPGQRHSDRARQDSPDRFRGDRLYGRGLRDHGDFRARRGSRRLRHELESAGGRHDEQLRQRHSGVHSGLILY